MSRIPQKSRQIARTGTQHPAIITDVRGDLADARLSMNGAIIHNLSVVGGPVVVGEQVQVDYTTSDPTIVATAKEWLSIEDILRAMKKLPEPLMQGDLTEWDKVICFCIDDPTVFEYFSADYGSIYDAQEMIVADEEDYGYLRRWGIRIPPMRSWRLPTGYPDLNIYVPCYIWGDATIPTVIQAGSFPTCPGIYVENIHFHFKSELWERPMLTMGIQPSAWAYSYKAYTGNPIRSLYNTYLHLPDQLFNGYIFRNCEFVNGWPGTLDPASDQMENTNCISIETWLLNGERTSDDFMIFDNCKFYSRDSTNPHLVSWYEDEEYWDGYKTHIYLYNCEVDVLDQPIPPVLEVAHVYSSGVRWVGVSDITVLNYHTILDNSDRAPLDHGHVDGFDEDAIHVNVEGEIQMVDEKFLPVEGDLILIEDSQDDYKKKSIQIGNMPFSGGGGGGAPQFFVNNAINVETDLGGYLFTGDVVIDAVYMAVRDPGSAGSTIVDININGTTIFTSGSNRPEVAYNADPIWVSTIPDITSGSEGDLVTMDVDQAATNAEDLVVILAISQDPASANDENAIHDNVNGEIILITEKTVPVANDHFLIEDSAASNAKKRVKIGSLTVVARCETSAAQSITNNAAVAIVNFGTVINDTHSAVTTGASWKFTAPVTGYYRVDAKILFATFTGWAALERVLFQLFKNDVLYSTLDRNDGIVTTSAIQRGARGSDIIYLTAGQYIDVRLAQNCGSNLALTAVTTDNYISIVRV